MYNYTVNSAAHMRRRVTVVGCVSGSIFAYRNELAKKTYRLPQRCNRLIKNVGFFIEQPLHKGTEFDLKQYW